MKKITGALAGFLFLFSFAEAQAGLCPLCRQALEQNGNGGLINGFYWSILLIGGVPLILISLLVWRIYTAEKKRRFLP